MGGFNSIYNDRKGPSLWSNFDHRKLEVHNSSCVTTPFKTSRKMGGQMFYPFFLGEHKECVETNTGVA